MTDRKRIAITVASAFALAVTAVAGQWSAFGSTEALVWHICDLAALGLTLVGVFVVNRWWAVLPAVSTVGVSLLAAAIYTPPDPATYESYTVPPEVLVLIWVLVAILFAAFLSLGLLARWIWDWFRDRKSSTTTPREIHR